MKLIRLLAIILLSNTAFSLFGQEVRGLNYNPVVKRASEKLKLKSTQSRHEVPMPPGHVFFDDFTSYGTGIYPMSTNWVDNSATITRNYSDSSISFGVATLDCFDSTGSVYGSAGRVNPSDTLTSKLIANISERGLFMSFFIQGGGKVDSPEQSDSLVLQFRTPIDSGWTTAWSTLGYQSNTFEQIILSINDSLLIDSSFQFRFLNFTSLSANEVQGKNGALSNSDYWHIDYIQIKAATNSVEMELINDMTINEPLLPVFRAYTLIPYNHIQYASTERREINTVSIRTYFPNRTSTLSIGRTHNYFDLDYNENVENIRGLTNAFAPEGIFNESDRFLPNFKIDQYPGRNYGRFRLTSYLTNFTQELDQYQENDTVTRIEEFYDFYAYDNGTATYGFGIAGADAYNSAFATKYELYQAGQDTLTGVYIYFNKALDNYTEDMEFLVGVWEDADTAPGDYLYLTDETRPLSPDHSGGFNHPTTSLNGFMRIDFEEDILVESSFYIGIQQLTTEFLNVGYDISFNSKNRMMYYADNTWQSASKLQGIPNGSLMIRPIFDHIEYPVSIDNPTVTQANPIKAFPNPFRNTLQLNLSDSDLKNYSIRILDLMGRTVYSEDVTSTMIYLEHLSNGIYILNVFNNQTRESYTQKIFKIE